MKPRRVIVTIEVESDLTIKDLRRLDIWECVSSLKVIQVQANCIKKGKP